MTAGEILRDGGLVLPPTPASPSRPEDTKEGRGKGPRNDRLSTTRKKERERDNKRDDLTVEFQLFRYSQFHRINR